MAKKLGYTPSDGSTSGGSYMKTKDMHPGPKPRQDGKTSDGKMNAGDHLSNHNGTNNPQYKKGK